MLVRDPARRHQRAARRVLRGRRRRRRDQHLRRAAGDRSASTASPTGPTRSTWPPPRSPARWPTTSPRPTSPASSPARSGPGTKFPSLGQIRFAELRDLYEVQAAGLLEGGVDLLIIETQFDLLGHQGGDDRRPPGHGRGSAARCRSRSRSPWSSPAACCPAPRSAPRCAAHRRHAARRHRHQLRHRPGRDERAPPPPVPARPHADLVLPNAGLPSVVDGKMHYDLTPDAAGRAPPALRHRARRQGRRRLLRHHAGAPEGRRRRLPRPRAPAPAHPSTRPGATSIYSLVPFEQDTSFLIIGERTNANGSQEVPRGDARGRLGHLRRRWPRTRSRRAPTSSTCASTTSAATAPSTWTRSPPRFATQASVPLVLDSTEPAGAWRPACSGSAAGPSSTRPTSRTARPRARGSTGCSSWPASTAPRSSACSSTRRARPATSSGRCASPTASTTSPSNRYGLEPSDLIFDALTFPLSTGDDDLRARRHGHHRGHPAHQGRDARRAHHARPVQRVVRPQAGRPPRAQLGVPARVRRRPGSTRPSCTRRGSCRSTRSPRSSARSASTSSTTGAVRPRATSRPTTRCRSCSRCSPTSTRPRSSSEDRTDWTIEQRLVAAHHRRRPRGLEADLDAALADGHHPAGHHQRRAAGRHEGGRRAVRHRARCSCRSCCSRPRP